MTCGWRLVISPTIPQDYPACYHSSIHHLGVLFDKMNLKNREDRGSSYQYMGWMSEEFLCDLQSREEFLS